MKSDLIRLIERYGQFEQQVRRQIERWCRPFCSICRHVCCRTHFCVETRESIFLRLVALRFSHRSGFSQQHGWLNATGCALVAGRPPVCYEFLCRKIADSVACDSDRHQALLVLSMVITHVGKQTVGRRHLVEATHATDLNRINLERFTTRFHEAEQAFHAAVNVLDGRPSNTDFQVLSRIIPPPRIDRKKNRRVM